MATQPQNPDMNVDMSQQCSLVVLRMISTEIDTYRNSPQELWVGLRDFAGC